MRALRGGFAIERKRSMDLERLYPVDFQSPAEGVQTFLRNLLVQSHFVPAVRHFLGWRGLKNASSSVEGWTARIKGHRGVFGVFFEEGRKVQGELQGRFGLAYFPHPEEERVESFSLAAAALTQQPGYFEEVRRFTLHPDLGRLFGVGTLELRLAMPERLTCLLSAPSRDRTVVRGGVRLPCADGLVELVPPGGLDQDLPAFSLASDFFAVLGASAAFNLGEGPRCFHHAREPGSLEIVHEDGSRSRQLSADVHLERLMLEFGEEGGTETVQGRILSSWRRGEEIPREWKDAPWWTAAETQGRPSVDKTLLGVDERPSLLLVTGYLGAGKTSFLRHFIEYETARQRFVAVIQNEIGETGLDGLLLDDSFTVASIDEGCVCCTLAGSLKSAVAGVLSQFRPDVVLVETTGLANPFNLLDDLWTLEELARFDSTTTVVDASNLEEILADSSVAADQIRAADVLVVNKTDLAGPTALSRAEEKLRSLNPRAPLVRAARGDVNPALLYAADPLEEARPRERLRSVEGASEDRPTHEGDRMGSVRLLFPSLVDREGFLRVVKERMPESVFRAKGVLAFSDRGRPEVFQYVRGRYELSDFHDKGFQERFLVFIGRDLKEEAMAGLFGV